jgi:hypothetical protein
MGEQIFACSSVGIRNRQRVGSDPLAGEHLSLPADQQEIIVGTARIPITRAP